MTLTWFSDFRFLFLMCGFDPTQTKPVIAYFLSCFYKLFFNIGLLSTTFFGLGLVYDLVLTCQWNVVYTEKTGMGYQNRSLTFI